MTDEAVRIEAEFRQLAEQLATQIAACTDDPESRTLRDALQVARAKALEGITLAESCRGNPSSAAKSDT